MSEEPLLTLSVPAAGKKYFGLSRNGAYDAAARGDLPTIRIGRLLKVPVRALERMLDSAKPDPCNAAPAAKATRQRG
jgi:Helix-turn-helix domain